jgi:ABC-type amino acid transport substrate-binding protein
MVFEKGTSLVRCVSRALAALKVDGTLQRIQHKWLAAKASAPVLD